MKSGQIILLFYIYLYSLLLSDIFILQHSLLFTLLIIELNRQLPSAAFSIPAFVSRPWCMPLEIAFCNILVVCLLAVSILRLLWVLVFFCLCLVVCTFSFPFVSPSLLYLSLLLLPVWYVVSYIYCDQLLSPLV